MKNKYTQNIMTTKDNFVNSRSGLRNNQISKGVTESGIYFQYSTKRGDTEAVFLVSFRQLVDDILSAYYGS